MANLKALGSDQLSGSVAVGLPVSLQPAYCGRARLPTCPYSQHHPVHMATSTSVSSAMNSQPNKAFSFLGVSCLPVVRFAPFRMSDKENIYSLWRKLSLLPQTIVALFMDSQEDNIRRLESKAVYSGIFGPGVFGTLGVQLFMSHTDFNPAPVSSPQTSPQRRLGHTFFHRLPLSPPLSLKKEPYTYHRQATGHQSKFSQGKDHFSPFYEHRL